MDYISHLIETYGIYAVFALCAIEGDLTLILSGLMAHNGFFGQYSFIKVLIAGTFGGVVGDTVAYLIGRFFNHTIKNTAFYQRSKPRIDSLTNKFGAFALVLSKYIYGIRTAMCISIGACRMPFHKFVLIDTISCGFWVLILAGSGYFFSGAITKIIGDFHQIGYVLVVIAIVGVICFYMLERFWIARKVEEAEPELIHKIEEKLHTVEEVAHEKLHILSEKLHLTDSGDVEDQKKEKKNVATRKN
ncbi:MAG: DedA family protein [Pyrinomonadaceae bacterium]|nr:DedA family protein [Pyrinomonadaceae bacterium]MCX7638913.1 DedA family protein [Pyrinomonadaceae bacterium]MDW8304950.1 DedA family protein [Acidobacteriota bacterium]